MPCVVFSYSRRRMRFCWCQHCRPIDRPQGVERGLLRCCSYHDFQPPQIRRLGNLVAFPEFHEDPQDVDRSRREVVVIAAATLPEVHMTVGWLAFILVRAHEHIAKGSAYRLRNARLFDKYAMPAQQRPLGHSPDTLLNPLVT